MTEAITHLPNGLTVVTHTMPHLETTSLGLWVGVGARHEQEREHGISHFLEHMSFKGTATRSAQAIAEEIEAVGGELNAATGLETTAYFARVLKGDEGVALELLADILLNSAFSPDEIDREREVILQEIAGTRDSPEDMVVRASQRGRVSGPARGPHHSRHRGPRPKLHGRRSADLPCDPLPPWKHGVGSCWGR